jgi:hypothetical protein
MKQTQNQNINEVKYLRRHLMMAVIIGTILAVNGCNNRTPSGETRRILGDESSVFSCSRAIRLPALLER